MSGKNLYVAAAVAFPILVLAAWTGFLQYSLWRQPRVLVAASGYDPRHLLSGRWIGTKLIAGNFLERFVRVSVFAKNMFTMFPRPKPALWNS